MYDLIIKFNMIINNLINYLTVFTNISYFDKEEER